MKTQNRQFDKQNGSALILVVVVTVLLAVIGVMFLMVSRASEMETGAVSQNKDLGSAVESVVAKINDVLIDDLFGNNNIIVDNDGRDEPYDATSADSWLCDLEPVWFNSGPDGLTGTPATMIDDNYAWPQITNLYGGNFGGVPTSYYDPQDQESDFSLINSDEWDGTFPELRVDASDTLVKVIRPKDRTYTVNPTPAASADWDKNRPGARADADGDGVADSRWVQMPGLTSSRGEPVFAAVRIIDNCAMLNLNAAHCFHQGAYDAVSFFQKPWFKDVADFIAAPPIIYHDNQVSGSGRYTTEINYLPFLRGRDLGGTLFDGGSSLESGDGWYNLMQAKGFWDTTSGLPLSPYDCQAAIMDIENPVTGIHFFDIGDELELRNRHLVTSKTEARFEAKPIGPPVNDPGVANYTLDAGGGTYGALRTPVDDLNAFTSWKIKNNPDNFDRWDLNGILLPTINPLHRYDRRHVCTVYSYDRNIRKGQYPLLDSEIGAYANANWVAAGYASAADYEEFLWNLWGDIFLPKGAVTTNIENSSAVQPYNNLETRKRILHLLYALREYYYNPPTVTKANAALQAAQIVANLIDYSDDDSVNDDNTGNADGLVDMQGPFYDLVFSVSGTNIDYGQQANADCTFITQGIIDGLMLEVNGSLLPVGLVNFGLNATDIVFGFERQPFISEVFANWDGSLAVNAALQDFAVELVNPYSQMIDIQNWRIKIGTTLVPALSTFNTLNTNAQWQVSGASPPVPPVPGAPDVPGYTVLHGTGSGIVTFAPGGVLLTDPITNFDSIDTTWNTPGSSLEIQLLRPAPAWVQNNFPDPTNPGVNIQYILADRVSDTDVRLVLGTTGQYNLERDDDDWKFIYGQYALTNTISAVPTTPYTMVTNNTANIATITQQFQIGVADDGLPLARWHDIEVLGLYGNEYENSTNPDAALTTRLANMPQATGAFHFDLTVALNNPLDYIATINRPDVGSLPGRININTAPVHVIAAAIPPVLADPGIITAPPSGYSSLNLARDIVNNRPYTSLGDLLTKVLRMKQYSTAGVWVAENVGMQSIQDDIEEEHWVLSNLANKFTVRSDVFTAYILVRLGTDGPQRRMIAIFDRSQVWDKNDRPKLVALHPVPDPR